MRGTISNKELLDEALRYLSRRDKKLGSIIKKINLQPEKKRVFNYSAIVSVIVNQQLSGTAAKTIFTRLNSLCGGFISPTAVSKISDAELRSCGLSQSKVEFIRLAQIKLINEPRYLSKFSKMDPEIALNELKTLKGIGDWSAAILLLFYLQHPDVFPLGDTTLKKAIEYLYGSEFISFDDIVLKWAPYRSVASICLWRFVDVGLLQKKK